MSKAKINLYAALSISLFSISSLAVSPQILKAVLSSKAISNVQSIDKMEVVATYRCPNCFDIAISGTNVLGQAYVKVRTQQNPGGALIITYIEGSK